MFYSVFDLEGKGFLWLSSFCNFSKVSFFFFWVWRVKGLIWIMVRRLVMVLLIEVKWGFCFVILIPIPLKRFLHFFWDVVIKVCMNEFWTFIQLAHHLCLFCWLWMVLYFVKFWIFIRICFFVLLMCVSNDSIWIC